MPPFILRHTQLATAGFAFYVYSYLVLFFRFYAAGYGGQCPRSFYNILSLQKQLFFYIFTSSRCITYTSSMACSGGQSPLLQQFWYVYILKCSNGTLYTGCSNNLEDRIRRHNLGQVIATKNILPVEIITYIAFTDKYKAYDFEKYLKQGSGRAFSKRHLH